MCFENFEAKALHVTIFKDGELVYDKPTLTEIKDYVRICKNCLLQSESDCGKP